jgi:hypothetical protein
MSSPEGKLLNPRPGGKIAEAKKFGIDLSDRGKPWKNTAAANRRSPVCDEVFYPTRQSESVEKPD